MIRLYPQKKKKKKKKNGEKHCFAYKFQILILKNIAEYLLVAYFVSYSERRTQSVVLVYGAAASGVTHGTQFSQTCENSMKL